MASEHSSSSANTLQRMVIEETKDESNQIQTSSADAEQVTLVTHMSKLAESIVKQINDRYEPDQEIRQLNELIETYFKQLWGYLSVNKEAKLIFYKNVLKEVSDKMLAEKLIQKVNVSIISY